MACDNVGIQLHVSNYKVLQFCIWIPVHVIIIGLCHSVVNYVRACMILKLLTCPSAPSVPGLNCTQLTPNTIANQQCNHSFVKEN